MNILYGYGYPFEPQYSSCSNRKPKQFRWEIPPHQNLNHLVLIDNAIQYHSLLPVNVDNLYGWVCESRSIVKDLSNFLLWNYDDLKNKFKKIFVSDKQLVSISSVFEYCPNGSNLPWISDSEYGIYTKTKLCSMIASPKNITKGHIIRHGYAERFKDKIDLFGGAIGSPRLENKNSKISSIYSQFSAPWNSKLQGIKDYMFHIVVENDFYDNYYTEKITDCFATGTIPVYAGSPSIGELFNMDGIIVLDANFDINSLTPELYYSKLDAIHDNLNRVINLEMADDILWKLIQ